MYDYKAQAKAYDLKVPPDFWLLSNDELNQYGCGPGGGMGDKLIPDTMYFLNVKVCCIVHDLDWSNCTTASGYERANETFLINLIRFINGKSNVFMRLLRRNRALTYYNAVQEIGKKYWLNDKRTK